MARIRRNANFEGLWLPQRIRIWPYFDNMRTWSPHFRVIGQPIPDVGGYPGALVILDYRPWKT